MRSPRLLPLPIARVPAAHQRAGGEHLVAAPQNSRSLIDSDGNGCFRRPPVFQLSKP